ncbi:MAG: hypothetical protein HFH41_10910 [Lachnospiraceae bacterium]|nr:hypothetical protein [Lachnospiraceae bacterium]
MRAAWRTLNKKKNILKYIGILGEPEREVKNKDNDLLGRKEEKLQKCPSHAGVCR